MKIRVSGRSGPERNSTSLMANTVPREKRTKSRETFIRHGRDFWVVIHVSTSKVRGAGDRNIAHRRARLDLLDECNQTVQLRIQVVELDMR